MWQALPAVVHLGMGAAFAAYALVGVACYAMLGDQTLSYPNVLTAFGDVPLVALGSLAVALVNALKMPLVMLPLRALRNTVAPELSPAERTVRCSDA